LCLTILIVLPGLGTSAHEGGPHLRIAHLSPSSPAVDIYINDKLTVKNLKYKDVTNYLSVEGTDFKFVFVPAGGKIEDSVTKGPITFTFKASEGSHFTLAAIGSLADNTFELFRLPADRGDTAATPAATEHSDHNDGDDHHAESTAAATQAKP
jgi:hypothetical protein